MRTSEGTAQHDSTSVLARHCLKLTKIYGVLISHFRDSARKFTGGSVGLFDGKRIGRSKEIKKLKHKIEDTEKEIESINSNISKLHKNLDNLVVEELISEIQKKSSVLNQFEIRKVEYDKHACACTHGYHSLGI